MEERVKNRSPSVSDALGVKRQRDTEDCGYSERQAKRPFGTQDQALDSELSSTKGAKIDWCVSTNNQCYASLTYPNGDVYTGYI
ncbi:hypothetical protein KIPB_013900, partial [Kipferlia bialata]|eukprot:g13900.t1